MRRSVYTAALALLAPVIWSWMALRARKSGGRWEILGGERFGRYPETGEADLKGRIWIHAVSLGETRAAQPMIQGLLDLGLPLLLTHTTITGRDEAQRLFAEAQGTRQLIQAWLPYDFPGPTRRFFSYFRPRCGILIEREVWPNLIQAGREMGIRIALVSARFSDSAMRQASWLGQTLRQSYASLDLVAAQTEADARRLSQAGARDPIVLGNLKFDMRVNPAQVAAGRAWRAGLGRPVISVASTRDGEEAMFIRAFTQGPALDQVPAGERAPLLMLIPRHPQRFSDVASLLQAQGLDYVRRSQSGDPPPAQIPLLLGDTLGEMAFYYAASDVTIIGGGFAPLGGQNLIEAGIVGTPIIVGPHMANFQQATDDAVSAGAALRTADADEALCTAVRLLSDEARRQHMGAAAQDWAGRYNGAAEKIIKVLSPWLSVGH